MKNSPFTLEEAEEIAEDFEDLADTGFQKEGRKWIISRIVVCQFGEANKSVFPEKLESGAVTAFAQPDTTMTEGGFDLSLLLTSQGEEPITSSIDIRTYTEMMGINYKFQV